MRILLAEDDSFLATGLSLVLRDSGFSIDHDTLREWVTNVLMTCSYSREDTAIVADAGSG